MLSYEQRVAKIKTIDDIDKQLKLAVKATKLTKRMMRNAPSFAKQIELNSEVKKAESIVRKLRSNRFNLEDEIMQRLQQEESRIENEVIEHFKNGIKTASGVFNF